MAKNPIVALALSKLFTSKKDAKAIRENVGVGEYPIDTTVKLVGTMKVFEDHQAIINAKVPWERLFTVALSKLNGVTIESLVREALAESLPLDGEVVTVKDLALIAVQSIKEANTETRKGAVKLNVSVEELVRI